MLFRSVSGGKDHGDELFDFCVFGADHTVHLFRIPGIGEKRIVAADDSVYGEVAAQRGARADCRGRGVGGSNVAAVNEGLRRKRASGIRPEAFSSGETEVRPSGASGNSRADRFRSRDVTTLALLGTTSTTSTTSTWSFEG